MNKIILKKRVCNFLVPTITYFQRSLACWSSAQYSSRTEQAVFEFSSKSVLILTSAGSNIHIFQLFACGGCAGMSALGGWLLFRSLGAGRPVLENLGASAGGTGGRSFVLRLSLSGRVCIGFCAEVCRGYLSEVGSFISFCRPVQHPT